MAEPLDKLGRRLETDPFFLGCPLRLYARSARLNEDQLAANLGCSMETLGLLRLCRAPTGTPVQFRDDIARIAAKFQVDATVLTEAVRRGQALHGMSQGPAAAMLKAARDKGTASSDGGDQPEG